MAKAGVGLQTERILRTCRKILQRRLTHGELTPPKVQLEIRPGIADEAYVLEDGPNGSARIAAGSTRGLIYGTGKFLRDPCWRGTSAPRLPVRGVYFATHFHNFYHDAPIEQVQHYIEELALWGVNSLSVWFDMHHYRGIHDPRAQTMINRLRAFLQSAGDLGMDRGLTLIANEGYAESPINIRAQGPGRGGFYGVEICPSSPGGEERILKQFEEEFAHFADIGINHVWIWPYDQGSCSCDKCKPWGSNGFARIARQLTRLARESFAGCKVYLSAWYMDDDEWANLAESLSNECDRVDGVILQPDHFGAKRNAASPVPVVGFPEISMLGMYPWGGFGANPQPDALRRYWKEFSASKGTVLGGWSYSEGIFEDLNKVILAQLYWDPHRPVWDIVREYAAYEFGRALADDVVGIIRTLEANHRLRLNPESTSEDEWIAADDPGAEEAYEIARNVNEKLAQSARESWRWRIIYLRALLDAELKSNGGRPNQACARAFEELIRIYHAQNAEPYVKPPLR